MNERLIIWQMTLAGGLPNCDSQVHQTLLVTKRWLNTLSINRPRSLPNAIHCGTTANAACSHPNPFQSWVREILDFSSSVAKRLKDATSTIEHRRVYGESNKIE